MRVLVTGGTGYLDAHASHALFDTPCAVAVTTDGALIVGDAGIPFDPTGAPEHTPAKTLAEAPLGGLGLPLIRRCSDWMSYRREGGRNHFVFGARWPKP